MPVGSLSLIETGQILPELADEMPCLRTLSEKTEELLENLRGLGSRPDEFVKVEALLSAFKPVTEAIDVAFCNNPKVLGKIREGFRRNSADVFLKSKLFRAVRTWQEGYPADYLTMEMIYANLPHDAGGGAPCHLDKYFHSRLLSRAIRSRLSKLSGLLQARLKEETGKSNWLALACGPCRELLALPRKKNLTINATDYDPNFIPYAKYLLESESKVADCVRLQKANAMSFLSAKRNLSEYGLFTTIYSPGVFDYLDDNALTMLIPGLYKSLAPGGLLILPFKDSTRYELFDYHWLAKWNSFFQRTADFAVSLVNRSGISADQITVEREETGAILFIVVRK